MIELYNVWKTHGSSFSGFSKGSLTFPSGQIVGILGENGSGKTTLLKLIMGLGELQEGKVLIDGQPVSTRYEDMAFITEEGSFFPSMTPKAYAEWLMRYYPSFDNERYERLLRLFKLPTNVKIRTFSKGQKSKLEIAAGFSKGASYILMDEPFLGNDAQTRNDFLKLMISSLKGHETIVIATHFVQEIEHIIDRAIIMRHGRVQVDKMLEEIHEQGETLEGLMNQVSHYDPEKYKKIFDE